MNLLPGASPEAAATAAMLCMLLTALQKHPDLRSVEVRRRALCCPLRGPWLCATSGHARPAVRPVARKGAVRGMDAIARRAAHHVSYFKRSVCDSRARALARHARAQVRMSNPELYEALLAQRGVAGAAAGTDVLWARLLSGLRGLAQVCTRGLKQ